MNDGTVPESFVVRSPKWLGWLMVANIFIPLINIAGGESSVNLVISGVFVWFSFVTFGWRAMITPNGVSFTNPAGKDFSHAWSELTDVRIGPPGKIRALVLARIPGGRPVRINNGVVRTADGEQLSPDTVQQLMQSWADAKSIPTD